MANYTSINISYNGTSSFVPSSPSQRQFMLDNTNPQYLRYCTLTQDCIRAVVYTSSVVIPLTQLYAVCAAANPVITWAPLIVTQPTSSHQHTPSGSSFFVSESAETTINYQWYSKVIPQSSVFYPLTGSVMYNGISSSTLNHISSSYVDNSSSFFCFVSNTSGQISSSIANFYVL